ncbi:hypothetical protein BD410DRAFT_852903 [Rickenella mellea]|uniref:Uncharacterized protein n=1 Tax=Rickenella mellea TaxID=50990 RepID=A0A4Y7QAK0_9AGAM|nr:hypothetical protein BD410DRAFT_852903 [Rickenella mellea]
MTPLNTTSPARSHQRSSSDSSNSSGFYAPTRRHPALQIPPTSNVAVCGQENPGRVPVVHPGNLTASVLHSFENRCTNFFEIKDVPADKRVKMILPAFTDPLVCGWINVNRAKLQALTFENFMTQLRSKYLPDNWKSVERRRLIVQSINLLLSGTDSHFSEEKLRQVIENGMTDKLAARCTTEKVDRVKDFDKWLSEVKRVDDGHRAELKEFEKIARNGRADSRRTAPFTDPSRRANTSNHASTSSASSSTAYRSSSSTKPLPRSQRY